MLHPMLRKIFLSVFACIVGLASLGYIVVFFQWHDIWAILQDVNFTGLIAAIVALHLAYILLRTWRWAIVLRQTAPDISFAELYWITAIVVSLANYTPGQLGEALKVELLKRRGLMNRLPGLGVFALERALDLVAIASMGVIGLALDKGFAQNYPHLMAILIGVVVLAIPALFILFHYERNGRVFHWLAEVRSGTGSPKTWAKMAAITVGSWAMVAAAWQISFRAAGADITWISLLLLLPLVTLGSILSLIPGGLGISEVLTSAILIKMGVALPAAQAGALILRLYGVVVLIFGATHLIAWLIYRVCKNRDCALSDG